MGYSMRYWFFFLVVVSIIATAVFHVSQPRSEGHLVQRKPTGFFQLKLYGSTEQWMGDTGDVARSGRTLALQWDDAFDAMSVRSGRNSYLTCRRGWVFYTLRTDATPSELWRPQYFPDGTFALLSLATKRYLRVRKNRLYCDAESSRDAAKFEGLNTMAVQSVCSTVNTVSVTDAVAAACWSVMGERSTTDKVVLFGTLKPLKRLGPANESDMYDSFIIAKRTLTNWARLPGVKPVVMADDPLNHQLIEEINAVHAGRPDYSRIDIISEFEMHPKFNQPTYRGLFQKAISTYPSAKAVMYANMDILFTSSLARTVDKVRRVYETKKKTKPSLKGWFVVGRRTNVSVPANWSMDGGRWESRMETELMRSGRMFPSYGEDYFIMNPELFNWTEIPPFVFVVLCSTTGRHRLGWSWDGAMGRVDNNETNLRKSCSDASSDFASSAECISSAVATTITTSGGGVVVDNFRQASRSEREVGEGVRRRAQLSSSGSQCLLDGSVAHLPETVGNRGRKNTGVDVALSDRRIGALTEKGSHIIPRFHMNKRQLLLNSYASMPLVSRESLSINAGLCAALGMTNDVFSSSAVSSIWRPLFDANEVLQLECIYGQMQWALVINVVFFSWRTSSLPLCEIIGITPTTDWSMQADKLLINWSGFWRLYVRGNRSRSNSLLSMNSPAEQYTPSVNIDKNETEYAQGSLNSVKNSIGTTSTTSTVTLVASSGSSSAFVGDIEAARKDEEQKGGNSKKNHNDFSRENNDNNTSKGKNNIDRSSIANIKNLVENSDIGDIASTGESIKLSGKGGNSTNITFDYRGNKGKATSTIESINTPKWWRLEELRCGAGFAVRNDLASGVNVYFGCSGHFGRALTFSSHVDALRRACCSVTSTTASLDLAARLRMNLITWHRTELDTGVGWRPFKNAPGITCRLAHSMGRISIGVSVKDVAAQCSNLRCWKEGCWWWQQQEQHDADGDNSSDNSITHKGVDTKKNVSVAPITPPPTTTITTSLAGEYSSWYSPYVGWLSWLSSPFGGGAAVSAVPVSTASTADAARNVSVDRLGFRERLSQAVRIGLNYTGNILSQTELDLTVGMAADRPQSGALRAFVSLSSH
ncbi:hypothetical protein LSM04_008335 [Trypanosoma melophagium]|uniref:uncharacterized protein n=1 Tax=Trypanosoma melophagium TaxID=715481 RepID=UPI00351A5E21|nr:hypothetical protein LSM04_008335 [Trypanosoma melophagium]